MKGILEKETVTVRLSVLEARDLAKRFRAFWTPMLIFANAEGQELHRDLGYLPPEEFAPRLLNGIGLCHFQLGRSDLALACFEGILRDYPASHVAPEARYWKGVCLFKQTKTTGPIYEANREIVEKYAGTLWARKLAFVGRYPSFDPKGLAAGAPKKG